VQMQHNVADYYNTYLTPKAVVNPIDKYFNSKLFLIAEAHSMSLFEAQKKHLQE
jgi:hypothetical protein